MTFSGQKPYTRELTITSSKKGISCNKNGEQSGTGTLTATTVITLAADETYRPGQITIVWTDLTEENIETI